MKKLISEEEIESIKVLMADSSIEETARDNELNKLLDGLPSLSSISRSDKDEMFVLSGAYLSDKIIDNIKRALFKGKHEGVTTTFIVLPEGDLSLLSDNDKIELMGVLQDNQVEAVPEEIEAPPLVVS